jgi:hypothetical protein
VNSPLFLLDPALTLDAFDHHHSLFNEINLTCREMQIDLHVLASAKCKTASFHNVIPFFKSKTYHFFESSSDYLSKIEPITKIVMRDYAQATFCDGARILMPTATPWHLLGLAKSLRSTRGIRIAVGLILPSSFWTTDPELQVLLNNITWNALDVLGRANLFVYSESGFYGNTAQLPICVSPMSDTTLELCKRIADTETRNETKYNSVTFGFFGGLFKNKGVALILETLKCANLQMAHRIIFFVPPQHLNQIAALDLTGSEGVVFNTVPLEYEDYLIQMGSVSAVLCCYDKAFYRSQMSGVVTEAAALGVPIIVSRETALHRFLLTYSPGADVPIETDAVELAAVLALPQAYWEEKRKSALIGASLVQELKSCRRFLTIALGY